MADHEVRDVMNRRAQPRLIVSAKLVWFSNPMRKDGMNGNLIFSILNDSDAFARYVALVIELPLHLKGNLVIFEDGILIDDREAGWRLSYSNHDRAPLFPRVNLSNHFKFRLGNGFRKALPEKEIPMIRYLAYADAMPPVRGEIDPKQLEC